MRKSFVFLYIAILTAILSGCIISANPTNKATVIVDPAEKKVFQINVFPSNATYTWKLDDVVVQQGTNKTYSYSPIENVVGKQTLVVEAKTLLGTDTYTWSIDTTLSAPSEQRVIDDYLGGEKPIQVTMMKYEGKVVLPQGLNINPDTLTIKSGLSGSTPLSSQGVFKAELNINATAMMRVADGNGDIYLMKLFPKSEDIREVNPVISTKSTAISLIAIQPGIITGEPDIDVIVLELINTLPETQALVNQIDSELSAGTFKLNDHFSQEILIRMGACFDALNKLKLEDVLSGTTSTKTLFDQPKLLMLDFPVDWDCIDDQTSVFYDSDGIDNDGVCVNANIAGNGQPSTFTMHNKRGRWAVLGVEQPGDNLETLDWIPPRPFQAPSVSDILIEIGKLGFTEAQQLMDKLFKISDGDTFMNKLKDIITSYVGLTSSQSNYVFPTIGNYSLAVVGAHFGDVSSSQYKDEIYWSFFGTTITEIVVPMISVIFDIRHQDVNSEVKDSIRVKACTDAWVQFVPQLLTDISDITNSIAQDGTIAGTSLFLQDFILGTLTSENGIRLVQCVLKKVFGPQLVRTFITQALLRVYSDSVFTPYIEAYNFGAGIFNAASSTLMFVSVLSDDNIKCVDKYTVIPPGGIPSRYSITDLDTLLGNGDIYVSGINNSGQIVGSLYINANESHAFLYSDGVMTDLGTLPGYMLSSSTAINESGQIVGTLLRNVYDNQLHAFLYCDGTMIDIGNLPDGSYITPYDINDSGDIICYGGSTHGVILYSDGTMKPIGGDNFDVAYGINNSGQIVGQLYIPYLEHSHAALYSGGMMTDLGTLGGVYSEAYGINNSSQIVGQSEILSGLARAFSYSDGTMIDLGTLPGDNQSRAIAINNSGQILGISFNPDGSSRGFLYRGGKMTGLLTLINPDLGWSFLNPVGINDRGQIIGFGNRTNAYGSRAFLMTRVYNP